MAKHKQYVATGYVYDEETDSFLLIFHKKSGKWLPPGGHLLEGEEPHMGVQREVFEEIGVRGKIINLLETPRVSTHAVEQLPAPFCVLHEPILAGAQEETHVHIDFVYVLAIQRFEALTLCENEVSRAEWVHSADVIYRDTYENVKQVCRAISSICQRSKLSSRG